MTSFSEDKIFKNINNEDARILLDIFDVKSVKVKIWTKGIEWLIVDKFVNDVEYRQILCDLLGDRMSLIYEYGERKEKKGRDEGIKEGRTEGIKEILVSLLNSGDSLLDISQKTGKSIKELEEILSS